MGTAGAALGKAPLAILNIAVGWQNTYKILSLIGIMLGIFIYFFVKDKPSDSSYDESKFEEVDKNMFSGMMRVFKSPQAWLIACVGALMYLPITVMGIGCEKV